MKNVKLILVLSLVALLLSLVLIRYNNPNLFRKDAGKWAAPSLSDKHILSTSHLNQVQNPLLL
ncbi:MAG: hypothetical protein HC905_02960 [Bacteroidales bacterium]|nr:hypothetical protein [Bacteroidales bacterium]